MNRRRFLRGAPPLIAGAAALGADGCADLVSPRTGPRRNQARKP